MNQCAAILFDTTRCTGCEQCVTACKHENGLGKDRPWRGQGPVNGLSSTRFCAILRRPNDRFVRQQCRHCVEPACVSACLVGAMQKTPEGAVIYDADRCMGCRYCMVACPYSIPRYDWNQAVPYVRKCNLCYHRLKQGKIPACVEGCPEKAAIFGDRAELLEEAHRRLAANPGRYISRVYGEHEVGGTSVLYISDIPLGFLGCQPDLDDRPLPDRTWASLKKVPPLIVGVAGVMTGVHWIIGRRMKLAGEAVSEAAPKGSQPGDLTTTEQSSKEDDV